MGFFQRTRPALLLAIGLLDTEQLDLIRSGVIAGSVLTTKGPSERPDALCRVRAAQFLAGAEGPDDQDAAIGLGGPLDV